MNVKKWRKIVSLLTTLIIAVMAPLNAMAATGSKYIKEVRISQAAKAEDAKAWLKNNGYTILDQNLNDGTVSLIFNLSISSFIAVLKPLFAATPPAIITCLTW